MSSYAILGATGNVGQSLVQVLLQQPNQQIHAYCRSQKKLEKLQPGVSQNNQVQVFEGSLQDTALIAKCLQHTRAAFLAVAQTGNMPGCSIARDTAHAVISALELLKEQGERLPKLIVLSSASTEHRLMSETPHFMLHTLYCAFSNVYDDLKEAERFLRSKESLVSMTFIKPGALSNDSQKGHVLSLETAKSPVSFLDLAAGMVEVANDDGERYELKSVAVNSTAKDVAFPWQAPMVLLSGLLFHYFPWTYKYLG